jgi:hypothetical protein
MSPWRLDWFRPIVPLREESSLMCQRKRRAGKKGSPLINHKGSLWQWKPVRRRWKERRKKGGKSRCIIILLVCGLVWVWKGRVEEEEKMEKRDPEVILNLRPPGRPYFSFGVQTENYRVLS